MKVLITGIGGLIGSMAARFYLERGDTVVGMDCDGRARFFGIEATVQPMLHSLERAGCKIYSDDIGWKPRVDQCFEIERPDVIIHCAAQPSHDKAAEIPHQDFQTNAVGTLNLLEATRKFCPKSVFVHMSTNKVYGDRPNDLEMIEGSQRWNLAPPREKGIDETLGVDNCMHSLFGASKLAGDIVAQEYGRYFDMKVGIFRGGCLTGPAHAGVELHGFLSYLIKCAVHQKPYTIFGYEGKQVRDQIHAYDVITAFDAFINDPDPGAVYNIGGELANSASVIESIKMIEACATAHIATTLSDNPRKGDHICYYTDMTKFRARYPEWKPSYTLLDIIEEMIDAERSTE